MEASPALSRIGLVGLGGMGQNLALNIAEKGFPISVYNRTASKVDETVDRGRSAGNLPLAGKYSPRDFVLSIQRPRSVVILVKHGAPVDHTIAALADHMDPGDAFIDGGNGHYKDTERRIKDVSNRGILYMGMGISGGIEGARKGPSLMPGGSYEAYQNVQEILYKVAAQAEDGPCVTYIGEGGSGNIVKIVHDGIEYGELQLISEAFHVLTYTGGFSNSEVAEIFAEWNHGEQESLLTKMAVDTLRMESEVRLVDKILDEAKGEVRLVDRILDKMGMKMTFPGMTEQASELLDSSETLRMRLVHDFWIPRSKEDREYFRDLFSTGAENETVMVDKKRLIDDVRQALYASRISLYAQAMHFLRCKSNAKCWGLNLVELTRIWKDGCIIRAALLEKINRAYQRNPNLRNLVLHPEFRSEIFQRQAAWKRVVALTLASQLRVPAMSSSMWYSNMYRKCTNLEKSVD